MHVYTIHKYPWIWPTTGRYINVGLPKRLKPSKSAKKVTTACKEALRCHRMPLWQHLWIASISFNFCLWTGWPRMSGSVSSILATPHITILLFHCRQSCIIHNHSWLWPNFTNEIFRGLRRHWHALRPDSIPYCAAVRDITFTSRDPQHHGTVIKARLTPNSVTFFFMRRSVLPGLKRIEMDAK